MHLRTSLAILSALAGVAAAGCQAPAAASASHAFPIVTPQDPLGQQSAAGGRTPFSVRIKRITDDRVRVVLTREAGDAVAISPASSVCVRYRHGGLLGRELAPEEAAALGEEGCYILFLDVVPELQPVAVKACIQVSEAEVTRVGLVGRVVEGKALYDLEVPMFDPPPPPFAVLKNIHIQDGKIIMALWRVGTFPPGTGMKIAHSSANGEPCRVFVFDETATNLLCPAYELSATEVGELNNDADREIDVELDFYGDPPDGTVLVSAVLFTIDDAGQERHVPVAVRWTP